MRYRNIIFSTFVLLCIVAVFFFPSFFLFSIWRSPHLKNNIIAFLKTDSSLIPTAAFSLLTTGLASIIALAYLNKHQYLIITMDNTVVSVDTDAIVTYLDTYWLTTLPTHTVHNDVAIHKNTIEIIASFSQPPTDPLPPFLTKTQHELSSLLSSALNYNHDFTFSFSFPPTEDARPVEAQQSP